MLWRTTVLQTIVFISPQQGLIRKHVFHMLWRTTVLQTTDFISQRGLIQKQHVVICIGEPLLAKLLQLL